ncbi:MAG: phage tail tape measure protein, partial [Rhodanobacter sp.]|nr:phage tail tape measure protein [Rhodanobacter sp.]
MSNADVEIRLRVNNQASAGIKKAEQDTQRASEKSATAAERSASRSAAATTSGLRKQRSEYMSLAKSREELGIRPERAIQSEIRRTADAYNRLKNSGTLSWREQARAADQMRQRVTQLTNEMGKLTTQQKAMGALKFGASVAGGAVAAGMVLKNSALKGMSFDEQLAHIANDAFQERDKSGRRQGKEQIRAAINEAVRTGGGTQESATGAMATLVSQVGVEAASKMLPELTKTATASGTDIEKLTEVALTAVRTYNVKTEEIPNILNQLIAAGHAGGFTLERMADFLPQQMARAAESGMGGRADFAALATLNQAAFRSSGNQEEAGQSVRTILGLMNDKSVADQIKRTTGVNLPKYLQSQRDKGVSSIDAFAGLLQRQVEKNSSYKTLQAKLATAKNDDERSATLESMAAIAQRS